jgi:hypothetical protein
MNYNESFQDRKPDPANSGRPPVSAELSQNEMEFAPSRDEVARRAYFTYVNQGSRQGHEVQHWLAAEEELIAERGRTRSHGFHHPT